MNNIHFKRKAYKAGGSIVVTIPEELRTYLEIDENSEIAMQAEVGKKGRFISLWKV